MAKSSGGTRLNGSASGLVLHGAAARNELRQLNADNFFEMGDRKEFSKYFDAENERRGNPVVIGSEGLQVGQMAKAYKEITYPNTPDVVREYRGKTASWSDYGRVTKIEGDKVTITDRGGTSRPWNIKEITRHTKDTTTGFSQMRLKSVRKSYSFKLTC